MRHSLLFTIPSIALIGSCGISFCSCTPHHSKIVYKTMEVVSFQPFYTTIDPPSPAPGWELPEGFDHYADLLKGAGDYLKNHINTISYDHFSTEYIQPSSFSVLGKNQIIMFEGHGSFTQISEQDPLLYSVMWTGRDWGAVPAPAQEDVDELRIIKTPLEWKEAITLHFVEEYVGDLSGSIVYLGNCFSGREVTFAQAFLNKGAEAVIGNSDTIRVAYNSLVEYTTIKKLGEINKKTGLPYTLYEALEYAKSVYGKNDKEKDEHAAGAEPLLFGNGNYRISK